ncbi:hypothetical protein GCM10027294_08830 [Marinactinospora endophytica]
MTFCLRHAGPGPGQHTGARPAATWLPFPSRKRAPPDLRRPSRRAPSAFARRRPLRVPGPDGGTSAVRAGSPFGFHPVHDRSEPSFPFRKVFQRVDSRASTARARLPNVES